MKTYPCQCENTLFFDSISCVSCGAPTGFCPQCQRIVPLKPLEDEVYLCGNEECGAELILCYNYSVQQVCNRCLTREEAEQNTLCECCRLTTIIPDLSVPGNRLKWKKLESAKRRVMQTVRALNLPLSHDPMDVPPLTFEFLADGPTPAPTGHAAGCITINIKEADDVEREKTRVAFGEPHRTLVGHFRHELGHYFWDRLVADRCEVEFRLLFGDEREPGYEEAKQRYYEQGPDPEWRKSYISAYASMHPWEDFAETFGAYLDMVAVLDTAAHFNLIPGRGQNLDEMIIRYQRVGITTNEFNRDMGLIDLVPEVFVPPVVDKMHFIHNLRSSIPKRLLVAKR